MLRETNDQDPYNLTNRGSENQGPNNWRRLWEANKKSRRWAVRAWLQRFSSSALLPRTLSTLACAFDQPEVGAMSKNLMHQTPEDQFLHWRQEMEGKQEEQERQMRELKDLAEHLKCENDHLRA